jgi:hypothetical protein
MLRVVVQTCDAAMPANVGGGQVHSSVRTFDIRAPELEEFLTARLGSCAHRQIVGVECLPTPNKDTDR